MSEILDKTVHPILGIIIVLFGMLLYNFANVRGSSAIKKFSDIKIGQWWDETQVRFVFSSIVIAIMFYMSWYYNELTAQHCFDLGLIGNLFLDKMLKAMSNAKTDGKTV